MRKVEAILEIGNSKSCSCPHEITQQQRFLLS